MEDCDLHPENAGCQNGVLSEKEWGFETFTAVPFDTVDSDKNGEVDWDEFEKFTDVYISGKFLVIEIDDDGDGKLSEREWAAQAESYGLPPLADVDGALGDKDPPDQVIVADEIVAVMLAYDQLYAYDDYDSEETCADHPSKTWCPGKTPGISLGSCREFEQKEVNRPSTCQAQARWQGGIVTESQIAKDTIFNLFDKDKNRGLSKDEVKSISDDQSIPFETGLEATFEDIDKNNNGALSKDELYEYLLAGGDTNGRWFTILFDQGSRILCQCTNDVVLVPAFLSPQTLGTVV